LKKVWLVMTLRSSKGKKELTKKGKLGGGPRSSRHKNVKVKETDQVKEEDTVKEHDLRFVR